MTAEQLQAIETELEKRGYRKYANYITSNETYAWFKTFGKEKDEDGDVIRGYQIAFRVWAPANTPTVAPPCYGLDFRTTALGTDSRMDFISNWEPVCDIPAFEHMAAEFNQLVRKYANPEIKTDEISDI